VVIPRTPAAIRESLAAERAAVHLYAALERTERGVTARLFGELRREAEKQSGLWERALAQSGQPVPGWTPTARVRLVAWLIGMLGPRRMLPVLSAMKVRGLALYRGGGASANADPGAGATERPPSGPPEPGPIPVFDEGWHRAASGGGALRAAVFGVNDGLVSNASLIIGVAGASPEPGVILLAGIAGLLAGGFSMAAGEYISVRTQRELLEHQLALERDEIRTMPEEEIGELTLIYRAKGLDSGTAEALARRIVHDPVRGLDTLAREELGLDPQGLASPLTAATASFLAFAGGALVPLAPFLVTRGPAALVSTLVATEVGLLGVGALMSLFTGRNPWWSGLRMALIGSAAAAATFAIGKLLGVSVN
jgi:VIT1/CCC1 family predicted Fe2+/Mn2+ transporter